MRKLFLTCLVTTGCLSSGRTNAYVKDPKQVQVEILGAGQALVLPGGGSGSVVIGYSTRVPDDCCAAVSVLTQGVINGNMLGPFAKRPKELYLPGNARFTVTGSQPLSFARWTKTNIVTGEVIEYTSSSRVQYVVSTPMANVERIEKPDIPVRLGGAIMAGVGPLVALGGYWLSGHDNALLKYGGYFFMFDGAFLFSMGTINLVRPKGETEVIRPQ